MMGFRPQQARAPWVGDSGGGGGAPVDAQYVVMALDATLTQERVLTAGEGIAITDGGAGAAVTVSSKDPTARTLLRPADYMLGARTCRVFHYDPATGSGNKYEAAALLITTVEETNYAGEVRAWLKPPAGYDGTGLIKIRHWGYFPTAQRSAFLITPTVEQFTMEAYSWWVTEPYDLTNTYLAGGTTPASVTPAATQELRGLPLVTLTQDAAGGAYADGKLLYLWLENSTSTRPNEFHLAATEILWYF